MHLCKLVSPVVANKYPMLNKQLHPGVYPCNCLIKTLNITKLNNHLIFNKQLHPGVNLYNCLIKILNTSKSRINLA